MFKIKREFPKHKMSFLAGEPSEVPSLMQDCTDNVCSPP